MTSKRVRNKDLAREHNRRYRERHRAELIAKRSGRWSNPIVIQLHAAKRDPVKEKARHALRNAVAKGRVVKPTTCPKCGLGGRIQAHHDDYAKPLEVTWLCTICHGLEHRLAADSAETRGREG